MVTIWRKPELRIARLAQELPQHDQWHSLRICCRWFGRNWQIISSLSRYHISISTHTHHDKNDLIQLERLQHAIDAKNGWQFEQDIKTILNRLELNPEQLVQIFLVAGNVVSHSQKHLVVNPELLLLDEPTNHLDIEAIQWLEDQLLNRSVGLLFITHDRALLQRLATRIIELDRGQLTSWPGDYANFLRRKEEMLHAEAKQNQRV